MGNLLKFVFSIFLLSAVTASPSPAEWTLDDAVAEILQLKSELAAVTNNLVPVGSIYVEYYSQSSPESLWPTFTWEDITSTYAGLFFRAFGSSSAEWGSTQGECAPRISKIQQEQRSSSLYDNPLNMSTNGWSAFGAVGDNLNPVPDGSTRYYEGLRFYTEHCEVRPINQAIRIWKRTA